MKHTQLLALIGLTMLAQETLASTIWLKDRSTPKPQICKNALITNPNNPDKIIGIGGVDRDGRNFTLTIDNPPAPVGGPNPVTPATGDCQTLPKNLNVSTTKPLGDPIVFSGTLTPLLSPIHTWGEGTQKRMECLKQGNNFTGVDGTAMTVAGTTTTYNIRFGYSLQDGCDFDTQKTLTPDGQPSFTRSAIVSRQRANGSTAVFTGGYHILNVNAAPEPSTVWLLLAGLGGLGALAWFRPRRSNAA